MYNKKLATNLTQQIFKITLPQESRSLYKSKHFTDVFIVSSQFERDRLP